MRDENNIPKLLNALRELEETRLEIGIFGEEDTELLMIASVHEFGSVKINVPSRSFIRAGFDENINKIQRQAENLLDGVLAFRIDVKAFYEALGGVCVTLFQQFLTELQQPALKEETVIRKGSSNPLIDTGRLRSSITWRVVR